jgi:hypothetical protein
VKDWFVDRLVERTVKKLNENFFKAISFDDRTEFFQHLLSMIPQGAVVGIGGSVTVRELGIIDRLKEKGLTLLDHWQENLSNDEKAAIRKSQLTCHVFITGTNAITENGEIVNMDGIGNRVASMIYGPEKVIIVAGYNKIVRDLNRAFERIKEIAAPMNAKRLGLPLPCAELGYCVECKSEKRICRILTVIQRRPPETDIYVLLLKEYLGF